MSAGTRTGRVLASHGRHALVEGTAGERVLCKLASRRLELVCGDEVTWNVEPGGGGLVTERRARRSTLTRTNALGRAETVVANLTQLVVLLAPRPAPDFFLIDRYLAAAELTKIDALLVLNKTDFDPQKLAPCRAELVTFAALGYPIVECSAARGTGLEPLRERLRGHTSLLVGQSGTGKSSLANGLLPGLNATTAELTRDTVEGKHTTSVSMLHHLPSGGDLIDSPGVRDFAPAIEWLEEPAHGFREFLPRLGHCRFQDCRHLHEPGCAIRADVESGQLTARRYESYRRLLRLREKLAPAPGPKRRS